MTKFSIVFLMITGFFLVPEYNYGQRDQSQHQQQINRLNQQLQQQQEAQRQQHLQIQRQQEQLRQQQQQQEQIRQQQQQLHQQQQEMMRQQEQMRQMQVQQQQQALQAQREQAAREARAAEARAKAEAHRQYVNKINGIKGEAQKEYDKAVAKLAISKEAKETLKDLKKELKRESRIYRSRTGATSAALGRAINAFCNLILDLVPAGSPNFNVNTIRAILNQALIDGNFDIDKITNTIATAAAEDKFIAGKDWRNLAIAFKTFAENLAPITEIDADRANVNKEVKNQLRQIDNAMEKYEKDIRTQENLLKTKQEMISSIDEYLALNRQYISEPQTPNVSIPELP